MTGSFNPIDVGDWSEYAYLGLTEKLFAAIAAHDSAAVRALITMTAGAGEIVELVDVNRRDHVGRTPLHMAILCKAVDIACILIDAGARMTLRLVDGRTALHLASQLGVPAIVRKLLEKSEENARKAKVEEEAKAAMKDDDASDGESSDNELPSSVNDWLTDKEGGVKEQGVAVVKNEEAQPSAHEADIPDDIADTPDVFEVNAADWDFAFPPLAYAIISGSFDTVQLLLTAGADPKLPFKRQGTGYVFHPLLLTVLMSDEEQAPAIIGLLLKSGASSAQADERLISIFHSVISSGKRHIVNALLKEDPHSKAALHVPAFTNHNKLLYPIVTAIAKGHYAIVATLLSHGAKVWFGPEDVDKAKNLLCVVHIHPSLS